MDNLVILKQDWEFLFKNFLFCFEIPDSPPLLGISGSVSVGGG
jgi:uncharacterized protein YcsI (UPF0317 family)